jgi:FolB domain-containing protein
MQKNNMVLSLNKLLINVKIGVEDDERTCEKEIELYIKFYLNKLITNDDINNTICYYKIATIIEDFCKGKEFKLIEFLCYKIHQLLKSTYGKDLPIEVRVIKKNPFNNNILDSAEFAYID